MSLSLVSAIEQDRALGRQAIELAMQTIRAPIRTGHETFGHDLGDVPWPTTYATRFGPRKSAGVS